MSPFSTAFQPIKPIVYGSKTKLFLQTSLENQSGFRTVLKDQTGL